MDGEGNYPVRVVIDGDLARQLPQPLLFAWQESERFVSEASDGFTLPEGKALRLTIEVVDQPQSGE
jgi:hypothetical protein